MEIQKKENQGQNDCKLCSRTSCHPHFTSSAWKVFPLDLLGQEKRQNKNEVDCFVILQKSKDGLWKYNRILPCKQKISKCYPFFLSISPLSHYLASSNELFLVSKKDPKSTLSQVLKHWLCQCHRGWMTSGKQDLFKMSPQPARAASYLGGCSLPWLNSTERNTF